MSDSDFSTSDAVEQLHGLAQFHQEVLDHLPAGIVVFNIIDRDTFRIAMSNRTAVEMSGFRTSDMLGQLTSATLDADDNARLGERMRRCIDSGTTVHVEESAHTPYGMLWFDSTFIPMTDADGAIRHILLLVRNITPYRERELAEQKTIAQQAAALMELSTPLLSISDTTVVMPLIGAIDATRVDQIMESLLTGVAASRATLVIIDITGVPIVDTYVANVLLRAAQAVRLLGAQAILTGIRPEVAQMLVGLGVDLHSIITRGTLQDGIAYALRR